MEKILMKPQTEQDFFERIKQNPRPVVVDFWAPWCVPCRVIEPLLHRLEKEYAGKVEVWKINADEQPEVLQSLKIYGIPTLVAFKNGQEVARRTGAASEAALSALFDSAISGEKPVQVGPSLFTRLLRLGLGSAILILAFQAHFSGLYALLAVLGAVIAFTAVYDRCPIYKAISTRITGWLRKDPAA
jgi:thioredoxin